jgi:hypothetical protein
MQALSVMCHNITLRQLGQSHSTRILRKSAVWLLSEEPSATAKLHLKRKSLISAHKRETKDRKITKRQENIDSAKNCGRSQ